MAKAKNQIEDPKAIAVWKIIERAVLTTLNEEPLLFGKPKDTVTTSMLLEKRRDKEIVVARQLCYYVASYIFNNILARENGSNKLKIVTLGSRYDQDHATVVHALNTMKGYRDTEPQILHMIMKSTDRVLRKITTDGVMQKAHRWYGWLHPKSEIY